MSTIVDLGCVGVARFNTSPTMYGAAFELLRPADHERSHYVTVGQMEALRDALTQVIAETKANEETVKVEATKALNAQPQWLKGADARETGWIPR